MRTRALKWAAAGAALLLAAGIGPACAADVLIGLITKTENNPFFVKMREGAATKAKELGVKFQSFSGKSDSDNDSQVAAIENLIAAGAKGILITPSDTKAIVPTIKKARDAGILVIALDTPLDPIEAADATFATDNFKAGVLIGQWAAATLGDKAKDAHVAFLDADNRSTSTDWLSIASATSRSDKSSTPTSFAVATPNFSMVGTRERTSSANCQRSFAAFVPPPISASMRMSGGGRPAAIKLL